MTLILLLWRFKENDKEPELGAKEYRIVFDTAHRITVGTLPVLMDL